MKTTSITDTINPAPSRALNRCARMVWQGTRRMGIFCWAIGVALINFGEG